MWSLKLVRLTEELSSVKTELIHIRLICLKFICQKQGDALWPLLFYFNLQHVIKELLSP
jgi:hypothetical protein